MEELLSVGIDLGTTTTQMVVSKLGIENKASSFSVPKMEICSRTIVYRSPVYFTPLKTPDTLDSHAIGTLIAGEYDRAGIKPEQVRTGAVIITGETARKENARAVLKAISDLAGEFVVETAGPRLESVLAAKGAGADVYAKTKGCRVLHIDIGGGTSNLALIDEFGNLEDVGCLNIGGRLIKLDKDGRVQYVSPVLNGLPVPKQGEVVKDPDILRPLISVLVQVLEEAAGLRPISPRLEQLITDRTVELSKPVDCISFSGGVAELIETESPHWLTYGDIGVLLGTAIRSSALCRGDYRIAKEALRATVIGAGIYTTELSGSTIFRQNQPLPLQNHPVIRLNSGEDIKKRLKQAMELYHQMPIVQFCGDICSYDDLCRLAKMMIGSDLGVPVLVLKSDYAKALGYAMANIAGKDCPLLCLDGLDIPEGSYLDIQAPVCHGEAIPVVIKTLAFS